jgi:hypothetical protein
MRELLPADFDVGYSKYEAPFYIRFGGPVVHDSQTAALAAGTSLALDSGKFDQLTSKASGYLRSRWRTGFSHTASRIGADRVVSIGLSGCGRGAAKSHSGCINAILCANWMSP